jgi:unsaturated chondroitin disaccharide hydrolase
VGKPFGERGGRRHGGRAALAGALALLLVILGAAESLGAPAARASLDDNVRETLGFAQQQLRATATTLPADRYPSHTEPDGGWATTGPDAWTSGFLPGSLWLAYEASGDPFWRTQAVDRLAALEPEKRDISGNDQGFKLLTSFGNAYRLTGNDAYRRVVVRGAESLASRYGPVVGATRSWGDRHAPRFTVIVDNLMNLELLFWAAKHGGDPAWYGIALSHALRTLRTHVRRDGSTYHVVDFDAATGAVQRKRTRQGRARSSTWSRGQAWAINGFTIAYRETGDRRFLEAARRVADWFIVHLPPDRVPYWDFDAPGIPNAPRDSSAAAIAASGLLELAVLEPDGVRANGYRDSAESIIAALSTEPYIARDDPTQAILLHGTQDRPRRNFDTGLSFGDYYFLEALLRHRTPPAPVSGPELDVELADERPLMATVSSDQPGVARAALLARRPLARGLGLRSAHSAVLDRGRARLDGSGEAPLRLELSRRVRSAIRGRHRAPALLSVVMTAADGRASSTALPLEL